MWQKLGTNCVKWHFSFLQFATTTQILSIHLSVAKDKQREWGGDNFPFPPIINYASHWKAPFYADHRRGRSKWCCRNNEVHSYFRTKTFSDACVTKLFELVYLGCKSMPSNVAKVGNKLCKVEFFFSSVSLLRLNMHILSIHLSVAKDKQGEWGGANFPFPPIINYASRWKAPFHADHWHMAELLFGYSTHKKYAPLWSFVCLTFKAFLCAFLFTIQQKGEQLYKMQWC